VDGVSRESDLQKLIEHARAAHHREQEFLVVRLKTSAWGAPGHGEIDTWSESLQVVEGVGWVLTHWSTGTDAGGSVSAYPVFRRRPTQPPLGPGADDATTFEGGHA
jgi:hypothetical protein